MTTRTFFKIVDEWSKADVFKDGKGKQARKIAKNELKDAQKKRRIKKLKDCV